MPHLEPNSCETPDLYFPMLADLYFPIIDQGSYGEVKKRWVYDRTIALNAMPYSRKGMGEITPQVFLQYRDTLIGRTKTDIRISKNEDPQALTNILITNIRSGAGQLIHTETAGPRNGKGTIYEIAAYDPHFAPYGDIDYYSLVIRRSENQAVE
jgi:hypothetical protein